MISSVGRIMNSLLAHRSAPKKNHFLLAPILLWAVRSPAILKKAEKEKTRERLINIPDHTVFSKRCLLKLS